MISQSVLASIAKFVVVGGLMAAGAGGVYFVVTRTSDGPAKQTIVAATATPTAAAAATATASPTGPTPVAGLTDTGYKAPDGSPLYAECVAPGLPLPPTYPQAVATVPVPSAIPDTERGAATPKASDVPAFDPLMLPASDASTWPAVTSACLHVAFRHPPGLSVTDPFTLHGYQQEATASFNTPDRRVVYELHLFYTTADLIALVRGSHVAPREYRFASNKPVTVGGVLGYVTYATEPNGYYPAEVTIGYVVSPRPNWYLQVIGFFATPYDRTSFEQFAGLVSSLDFTP